jgi:amidase
MVPIAHATDAGGSIRIPASMCGLVGLKPSRGRVSAGPDEGNVWGTGSWHVHALTRSIRDTAVVLDLSAGYAAGDPFTAPPPACPFAREVEKEPGRLRIGFMARTPHAFPELHPDCRRAVLETASLLEKLGHDVEEAHPPSLDEASGSFDLFLELLGSGVAYTLERWSRRVGRAIGPDDVEPYTWAFAQRISSSGVRFLEGLDVTNAAARRFASWWSGRDLLLTPTLAVPPFELGFLDAPPENPLLSLERAISISPFCGPYNMSGLPAISLPLHWNDEGLPIGVQLGAAYGREDLILRVAAQLERARPWSHRRPPVHA